MTPLTVLVITTVLTRTLGAVFGVQWIDGWQSAAAVGLAAMFALTATAHFMRPRREALIAMVPSSLPRPGAWVTLTGLLEIAGVVGLLLPATSRLAAICLLVLLVVMFPANVRASRIGGGMKTMPLPLRGLVQLVFAGACTLVAVG